MKPVNIIFLHHSTGNNIWRGNVNKYVYKLTKKGQVQQWFQKYNRENHTDYRITDRIFPAAAPYGWKNYPFDYYNIWVKHAGETAFQEEPTLEMLTRQYNVIIFKHCFPVSNIVADIGIPDADSEEKRLENYKIQYLKLKEKLHEFPDTKFILWTNPALTEKETTPENAARASEFQHWVMNEWNQKGDNIYLFDFYTLETEGGLYIKPEYAAGESDSHPNKSFSARVAPLFSQRIADIIVGKES